MHPRTRKHRTRHHYANKNAPADQESTGHDTITSTRMHPRTKKAQDTTPLRQQECTRGPRKHRTRHHYVNKNAPADQESTGHDTITSTRMHPRTKKAQDTTPLRQQECTRGPRKQGHDTITSTRMPPRTKKAQDMTPLRQQECTRGPRKHRTRHHYVNKNAPADQESTGHDTITSTRMHPRTKKAQDTTPLRQQECTRGPRKHRTRHHYVNKNAPADQESTGHDTITPTRMHPRTKKAQDTTPLRQQECTRGPRKHRTRHHYVNKNAPADQESTGHDTITSTRMHPRTKKAQDTTPLRQQECTRSRKHMTPHHHTNKNGRTGKKIQDTTPQ